MFFFSRGVKRKNENNKDRCDHTGDVMETGETKAEQMRRRCKWHRACTFYHFKLAWTRKMAGRSLILFSLRPRITCHPQSHRPSHRKTLITGCHYVWLHLSLSLSVTLKHCSLRQKTLQSGGRAGSIESMSSDSFLPTALAIDMFCFFLWFRDCYKDECRSITWEHEVVGVMMYADLGEKKKNPAEAPTEATSLSAFIKTPSWLLHMLCFISIID